MTQPEALRLAEELDAYHTRACHKEAAAELRRLYAENERLHQINQSHEMKLSVRGYEIQIADLEAQRDALLEALKVIVSIDGHSALTEAEADEIHARARAAIRAVEDAK